MNDILNVRIKAGYGTEPILEDVQFDLQQGERLGLVGTSGAGKSTLVLALMGLLPWRRGWIKGEVVLEGVNLLALNERQARQVRGKRIALVPQSPLSALNSALSLQAHFEEAWRAHEEGGGNRFRARIKELLQKVRLPAEGHFLSRKPGEISVGQAQRVVLALALLHRPSVLIADEPTSALDPSTQVEILELLRQSNREDGTTVLYISHDLLSVLQLCDRMAVLQEGRIVECLPVDRIEELARHPATLALLRTLPVPPSVLRKYAERRVASPSTSQGLLQFQAPQGAATQASVSPDKPSGGTNPSGQPSEIIPFSPQSVRRSTTSAY
ncbi:ATP-binding cassette domain-containing protein [Granulicella tundricola]|uniref:ABC transporter related protein n=1 Tax=Granulicella tundricola (strain ATCC BAA-1859 / DSM 23138 / MP5ACTX9) TaxID=1198114 RepID=E8WZ04_GRATM|nr:ABC transporter ATP-binding protein [Granulicella tundricola]ADW69919.1 ABC transporter related protein [Granulicella tundricola MP5ACTX9]